MGAIVTAASFVLFVYIMMRALTSGPGVLANPWGEGATTIE